MPAQIALAERTEDRVGHGVEQRVAVGVAARPRGVRELDSRENAGAPFDQAVHVEPDPDALAHAFFPPP